MKSLTKALHEAIVCDDLSQVQNLVESHGAKIEERGAFEHTALHVACRSNNRLDIVAYLVENCKANVEAKTAYCWTPVLCACVRKKTEIVKYLVTFGGARVDAEINTASVLHLTILHYAICWPSKEMVQCLVLDCGVNVNATDKLGRTALHLACTSSKDDSVVLVQCLVETCRADIYAKDKDGQTALHHAIVSIHSIEKSRILVLSGGGVLGMTMDNVGRTALHLAASKSLLYEPARSCQLLRLLVEHVAADYN